MYYARYRVSLMPRSFFLVFLYYRVFEEGGGRVRPVAHSLLPHPKKNGYEQAAEREEQEQEQEQK